MKKGITKPNIKNIVDPVITPDTYYQDYMYTTFSMFKILLDKSPLHFKYYSENPIKESAAMRFGTAFHKYVLEGESFEKEYIVEPNIDKRTTLGKKTWLTFVQNNASKKWITEDNMKLIKEMYKVITNNKHFNLMNNCLKEHIHLWENKSRDMLCKCRLDAVNFEKEYIIDIKTTRDASPKVFEDIIVKNKYHMQAAYYLDGTELKDYYIFAIEKSPPYGMCIYKLDKSIIQEGRNEYVKGLAIMKEIKVRGEAGYNNDKIKTLKWN